MGMVAILVMWPWTFEQTFIPLSHRSSIWNLTLTGPVVSEEKMFKKCGRTTEADLSYKLAKWAFGSSELKTYTVGCLSEVILMSTHNICFYGEIRIIIP